MIAGVIDLGRDVCGDPAGAEAREWLVANGIGGYACGTVAETLTRSYHGLLVAAHHVPLARRIAVAKVDEAVGAEGARWELGTNAWRDGSRAPEGYRLIERFRLEGAIPVWTYALGAARLEKRIWLERGSNVGYVEYRLVRGAALDLDLRVLVNDRPLHAITQGDARPVAVDAVETALRVRFADAPLPTWIDCDRGTLRAQGVWYRNFALAREAERGLAAVDEHYCAALWTVELRPHVDRATLLFAAQPDAPDAPRSVLGALARRRAGDAACVAAARPAAHDDPPWIAQLAVAADAFLVARPLTGDAAARTIIAGYPWFGDWGRDTMIALPGLTLATGRAAEGARILRTFARFVDGGMLPNVFPDGDDAPAYNTVDAALWFVEAVRAYDAFTGDVTLARDVRDALHAIVAGYERGTRYGIGVDPRDGLVRAGEPGVQLTWMDAKVGDWVVTPRIGKPVEINALWYNALRTLAAFARRDGDGAAADDFTARAERVQQSFARFWNAARGYCFDVIDGPDGDDPGLRPNMLLAVGLAHPVLAGDRARAVVEVCGRELLTSSGLRSLGPAEPGYRARYAGGVVERDGAYHQGTVWPWLIGPWIDALLAVGISKREARTYLEPFAAELRRCGLGTLAEIADASAPFAPRGCIAQAWSAGAVLWAWRRTAEAPD